MQRSGEFVHEPAKLMPLSFLERVRATKGYDFLTASPLIVWYWFGLHRQLPLLMRRGTEFGDGSINLNDFLQFTAIAGSAAFNVVAIYLLMIRTKPLARSKGILPRATALAGSFFGTSLFFLPAVNLSLPLQAISNLLIFSGSGGAILVLFRLGRAFAMLPEARQLDMSGPYAIVRHPLYVFETIAFFGLVLQFQQPWAVLIMLMGSVLMGARAMFEERVLEQQFPQYAAYRSRTARFVPGFY